ncbi:hypothetical protein [Streptomyces sp. NPDC052036]|uniref:hypothetical protein n=1 Tax=Streptomyces sp. NPDC052036 TaxID=3155171 RepID=UPI0034418203
MPSAAWLTRLSQAGVVPGDVIHPSRTRLPQAEVGVRGHGGGHVLDFDTAGEHLAMEDYVTAPLEAAEGRLRQ